MRHLYFLTLVLTSSLICSAAHVDSSPTFKAFAPCLQAPAETTMGVSWAVTGLAKGEVEVATNPQMKNARLFKSASLGLSPIDSSALQVRLENLKPNTRYYYRTITTPFTSYRDCYSAKLGQPIQSEIHSFTTLGPKTKAHFCVINDTHANKSAIGAVAQKVKELHPTALIFNGDATNTTQDKPTAISVFLNPPIPDADYTSDVPCFFENGNHDYRGSWIAQKEEVILPRHPAERTSAEWNLKWNFAVRMGELALIGLDTGEDKPDTHPILFGLASYSAYRKAQAQWLKKVLARADIAQAPIKIAFCHIPLYMDPKNPSYKNDGTKYADWSRECYNLWAPLLEKSHVKLIISGHDHGFQYADPSPTRPWTQIIGGGPHMSNNKPLYFPTVIEGFTENKTLKIRIHNVREKIIQKEFSFDF